MRNIDKYVEEYCSTDFEQKYMVKYRRKKVLEVLDKYKPARILEVGCGMDSIAKFYNGYKEFTIVEPGERFLANAKENIQAPSATEIIFIQGFLEDSIEQLQKKNYDFIIVSSLLHEVENPELFVKRLNLLCNKDTIVHINVPNELSMHRVIAYECGMIDELSAHSDRNISLQQNKIFNMETLKKLICECGDAKIIETGSYFLKPFTHNQMDKCLENGIISEQVLDGFYNMIKYVPEYGAEIYCNYKVIGAV